MWLLFCIVIYFLSIFYSNIVESVGVMLTDKNHVLITAIKITTSILNSNIYPDYIYSIVLDKYADNDNQVRVIENFPSVVSISMSEIGQKDKVRFRNLSKLETLNLNFNELKYISSDMISTIPVNYLWISNNKIKKIEEASFGHNIIKISLSCNELDYITANWFSNPQTVEILSISGNHIKFLPKDLFKNFKNLREINLEFNDISTIGPGVFTGRDYYLNINLGYNKIREFNSNIFIEDHLIGIVHLDLRYNKLSYIPKKITTKILVWNRTVLDGNPLQCSCYYEYIEQWAAGVHKKRVPKDLTKEKKNIPHCVMTYQICKEVVDEESINYFEQNLIVPTKDRDKFCCYHDVNNCFYQDPEVEDELI